MEIYFINWFVLLLLSTGEKYLSIKNNLKNKILITLVLFLILFIGLRINVGCDWITYKQIFNTISNSNIFSLEDGGRTEIGYAISNKIIYLLGGNIYLLNIFMSSLFVIPLAISFKKLKYPFLSFLIAYPYLIVVVGMGPMRQSAAMSLIVLSSFYLNKNFRIFSILNIIAFSFHAPSIFTSIIIFLGSDSLEEIVKRNWKIILFFLLGILSVIYFYSFGYLYTKFESYLFLTRFKDAKSHILIWIMNILPYILFIIRRDISPNKIHLFKIQKVIFVCLCFLPLTALLDTTITYRLLINFIPFSIFLYTDLVEHNFLIPKEYNYFIYILFSILLLSIWLNFAKHSYCWIPYRINYIQLFKYKIMQLLQ